MRAIILSGGQGTRLWPISQSERPKQYIKNSENKTGLQKAVEVCKNLECKDISVVANLAHKATIEHLNEESNFMHDCSVIYETTAYNTMQAILNSVVFQEENDDWTIVLPTDFEMDCDQFCEFVKGQISHLQSDYMYLLASEAKYSESSYGYIKITHDTTVAEFIEKPSRELATILINEGYFWNCGIFIFKKSFIMRKFGEFFPNRVSMLQKIKKASKSNEAVIIPHLGDIDKISFDKGIVERIDMVKALKIEQSWIDIGSWGTYHFSDVAFSLNDNLITYDAANINLFSNGSGRKFAVVGLDNITVVESDDVTLIVNKQSSSGVA